MKQLKYACEITLDDALAIELFIRDRISPSTQAERGSNERQIARAVKAALPLLAGALKHAIQYVPEGPGRDPQRSSLQAEISTSWNALWALSSPWQSHCDFNPRWRHVKYWDARHEEATKLALE